MRLKTTLLAGAVALAVVVAACGQGDEPAAPSGAASAATAAATEAQTSPANTPAPAVQAVPSASPGAAVAPTKLNLNTATREQFLTVPGVGDRMVREFEEYRPYVSVAQFRREIGKYVSQEQVSAYLQYVFVPVNPNQADAETLQQLPGVDADEPAQLIAGRPYASVEAFLARLGQYAGPSDVAVARAYLTGS